MEDLRELTGEALRASLSDEVLFWAVRSADAVQWNARSCDCREVILVMRNRILSARKEGGNLEDDGCIRFFERAAFDEKAFDLRILPPNDGRVVFVKVCCNPDGTVTAAKYRYGDRYLFLFSCGYEMTVTKSIFDLMEEDDTPMPDFDDSVLFDFKP